jgi:hypothetical protein
MIRRMTNHNSVGVVYDEEDYEPISYCSTCMAVGEMNRLKQAIYLDDKGKLIPNHPDSENFKMCWVCGLIIPTRETKLSGKISGIQGIEISQNPYDEKKGLILGNNSKDRYKKLRRRQSKHPDKEVQRMLEDGYELKSYLSSMPQ